MQNILVVFISFLLGGLGAWLIQKYGYKLGIIDVPNERSSHSELIPKGGGIGVLAAFVFCAAVLNFPPTFWMPAFVLSIVSFFGDRVALSAKLRLIVQFVCGFIFLIGLFYSAELYLYGFLLGLPLAVFIVGTSNFFNFMDGINGIAGISGTIGFLFLGYYGTVTGSEFVYVVLCFAIAFSCVGFLPFNVPKATVFMGDVGSILLGFIFACLVVKLSKSLLDFICLAGFLFPFYADELTTMVFRIKDGDPIGKPHRKHFYQLLVNEYGIEHWKISTAYGLLQLIVGILILTTRCGGYVPVLTIYLVFFVCLSVFFVCLRKR